MFTWLEKEYPGLKDIPPEAMRFVKQDPDSNHKPERLTWDAKLGDNFTAIDELTSKILMLSEIDKQLVGLGEAGAESGRALRLRLIRTIAKVNRKWQYFAPALEKVLELAQMIESKEPVELRLKRSDGLPSDRLEDIQSSTELVAGQFSTHVDEIMKLHDENREDAEERWERIQAEDDAERNSEALQGAVGRKTPIPVNVNLGSDEL